MFPIRVLFAVASVLLALTPVPAQQSIELPRALLLGAVPVGQPVVVLTAVGAAQPPAEAIVDAKECVLRIDRKATAAAVTGLLIGLQARGVTTVHFVATLPDGTEGCFGLRLPAAAESATIVTMRMHRERPGVPANSVVPLLQRMQRGLTEVPFVVRIEAPPTATFQQVLAAMAALQSAGVPAAVISSRVQDGQKDGHADGDSAFALDLGPLPLVPVSARAVPQPRPTVVTATVGLLTQAPAATWEEVQGGAGGRYGGRGGRGANASGIAATITAALEWLTRQQQPDGSFVAADGKPDVEATALAMLAVLGNGNTLVSGPHRAMLGHGIGWLIDQQREDGTFGNVEPQSTRRDALVTYALAEAYGLSRELLLRGALEDALAALGRGARADGGFAAGVPAAASDAVSTAMVMAAFASAGFFAIDPPMAPVEIVAWFTAVDADPKATQEATAAALFSRFFAGLDPKEVPAMNVGADHLARTAGVDDPWACYWTTYALFQMGGRFWKDWSTKVAGVNSQQLTTGEGAGSWSPVEGESVVTTTCLRLLTIQAYFRYSRLVR